MGLACKQRASFASGEFKLRGIETSREEVEVAMLSVCGSEKFYYLRKFMIGVVSTPECFRFYPPTGELQSSGGRGLVMMFKDRHTVPLYSCDKRSCLLYEQRFEKDYTFMKKFLARMPARYSP